jgi:hypothetical protein
MAGVGSSLQKLLGIVKARPLSTAVVVLAAWPLSLFLLPILLPAAVLAVVGLFLMPARFQGTSARSASGSVQLQELPVRKPEAGARAANRKEETATATEKAASAASVSEVAGAVGTAGVAGAALAARNQAEGNKKAPGVAQEEKAASNAAKEEKEASNAAKEEKEASNAAKEEKAASNAAKQEKEVAAAAPTKDDGLDWNFPKAGERSAPVCGGKDLLASWERI